MSPKQFYTNLDILVIIATILTNFSKFTYGVIMHAFYISNPLLFCIISIHNARKHFKHEKSAIVSTHYDFSFYISSFARDSHL